MEAFDEVAWMILEAPRGAKSPELLKRSCSDDSYEEGKRVKRNDITKLQ